MSEPVSTMVAIKTVTKSGVVYIPPIEPLQNGYRITKADLYSDSTGRSAETGALMQYLIRSDVVSIELQYSGTVADIGTLESIFTGTSLSVEYNDNGTYVTKNMYPSDRVKETESLKGKGSVNFSVTLTEI